MKTFLVAIFCSIALVAGFAAQSPSPSATVSPTATASATTSPDSSPESDLEKSIRKKNKRHFSVTFGDKDLSDLSDADKAKLEDKVNEKLDRLSNSDVPEMVLPIVAIVFFAIFGAPVLIVACILYFAFSKSRMQHRTIRMMVEKGQPVPHELLAPPAPAVRQRSDMRRGVILIMVGAALTVCFGAWNDWEGGAWAIGIIPLLIGAGYLLVWKLEGGKQQPKADNPPPLP